MLDLLRERGPVALAAFLGALAVIVVWRLLHRETLEERAQRRVRENRRRERERRS